MLAGVPILSKPKIISFKNRWLHSGHGIFKEVVALVISLMMMTGIYLCTLTALRQSSVVPALATLGVSPSAPFSMILSGLFGMLFLTAVICAFSTLFMSRDLEIAFSAPISRSQFLLSICTDVACASGWMVTTLGIPFLLACGAFFDAGILYYLAAPVLFISLFIPVVLCAVITALGVALVLPASRGRTISIVLCLGALGLLCVHLYDAISPLEALSPTNRALLLATFSAFSHHHWFPTVFCADAIVDLMHGTYSTVLYALGAYALSSSLLWFILQGFYSASYHRAFSKAHAHHKPYKIHSRSGQRIARILFPLARSTTRAVATKEFKVFSRDITHTVQIGMLLAICFIYLYTFKRLKDPVGLGADALAVWDTFLLLGNVVVSSFVILSICSRFIFPSVSLEGSGFWIVQSSPLSYGELLRAKCKGWLLPLSAMSAVIFASGAMALDADGSLVIASLVAGLIISYGFVGVSVGLGAVFAKFDCDHSTQVSTSLGGLMLIITCILLLICDTIPLAFTFGSHILFPARQPGVAVDVVELYIPLAILLAINIMATALSIRIGRRALRRLHSN